VEPLRDAAAMLLDALVGIAPNERVSILTDAATPPAIAQSFNAAAKRAARECRLLECGDPVLEALESDAAAAPADVIISLLRQPITHTDFVRRALARGARLCNLRDLDEDSLLHGAASVDPRQLRSLTDILARRLSMGERVRVTTSAGTDLTFSIRGRTALALHGLAVCPGQIGGAPNGEACVAPREGTAAGIIVDPFMIEHIGEVTGGFVLKISQGRATDVDGGEQAAQLRRVLGRADEHAANVAEFAMGTNARSRLGSRREAKKKLGTIHVALGDNATLGGTVTSAVHRDILMTGATVEIDDERVLIEGRLGERLADEIGAADR
jgi:leucyl aminopeptidase (aminopeptidase T)